MSSPTPYWTALVVAVVLTNVNSYSNPVSFKTGIVTGVFSCAIDNALKPLPFSSAYKPGVPVLESFVLDIAVFITTFKASPNHCFKFWVVEE